MVGINQLQDPLDDVVFLLLRDVLGALVLESVGPTDLILGPDPGGVVVM